MLRISTVVDHNFIRDSAPPLEVLRISTVVDGLTSEPPAEPLEVLRISTVVDDFVTVERGYLWKC